MVRKNESKDQQKKFDELFSEHLIVHNLAEK